MLDVIMRLDEFDDRVIFGRLFRRRRRCLGGQGDERRADDE
jgi:hypothetical protein